MKIVPQRRMAMLFAAVAVLLPLQFWFARTHWRGEPYPAILLPAFEGSMIDSRGLVSARSIDVVVTFADGGVEPVPLRALFDPAPSSHIIGMAGVALRPKPAPPAGPPGPESRLDSIKRQLLPGFAVSTARRFYWSGPEPDTIQWLRARMRDLFPHRRATQVRVDWYRDTYAREARGWTRDRSPIVSLDFAL